MNIIDQIQAHLWRNTEIDNTYEDENIRQAIDEINIVISSQIKNELKYIEAQKIIKKYNLRDD
jgi:hypothetical protein